MTIKIIKEGIPQDSLFQGKCSKCNAIVEFNASDATHADMYTISIKCPTKLCGRLIDGELVKNSHTDIKSDICCKLHKPLSDDRKAKLKGSLFEHCETECDIIARHFDVMA